MTTLPNELKSVMQNGEPAVVVSCHPDGVPNSTVISQVYWVDEHRIALSFQFFNKTHHNVRANPKVQVALVDGERLSNWVISARYDHSQTEGPVFDEMDMQIQAIASATGMSDVFKLRAADIYDVISWEQLPFVSRG